MALGAVLIAIASLPLALRTLGIGRTALNQFKPVWMLLWEGSSSDAAAAGPALDELLARVHAPQCPERLRESILARAVEYQADERLTWHPGWGAILEWGLLSGRLNEQQRSSFAEHALNIHVLMRARVRHGQEVPFALEFSPARMDPAGTLGATITILDWRGPGAEGSDFRSVMSTSGLSPAGKARMFSRAQVFPPVGEHRLHLECSVLLANPVALQPGPIPATAAQAVLSIPADLSVVETGAPVIQTTREESLGARIRAALRIPRAGVPPPIAAAPARPDATLTFSDTLAVDASATVLYRIAGKEYAAGSLDLRANKPIPVFQLAGPWDPGLAAFRGNRVDLILRFGAEAAERTIDVTQSWEGTVEFLDVPINWGQDGPPPKDLPGPN